MSLRVAARCAFIASVATAAPVVGAAQWSFAPSFGASVANETNPRLAVAAADEQRAFAVDLGMRLLRRSETTSVALDSSAARRQYDSDSSLNRSDLSSVLVLEYSASERLSWSAQFAADRNTTLTSELGTSGETSDAYRHESIGAQLRPAWQLTERWSVSAQLQQQRDYYPSVGSGLSDYRYTSVSLNGSWQMSPRDSLGIAARTGQVEVVGGAGNIRDAGASLEYRRSIDERWHLRLSAGPTWARGNGSRQRGEAFDLDLTRDAEYWAVTMAAERSLAPTGRGYLTRRDSLSLQLRRDLAPQLSGSLAARYLRSRDVIGVLGLVFDDVRYRRIEAGLSWAFAQQWSTRLNVGYADQRRAGGRHASGVDVGLGIRWNGRDHVF